MFSLPQVEDWLLARGLRPPGLMSKAAQAEAGKPESAERTIKARGIAEAAPPGTAATPDIEGIRGAAERLRIMEPQLYRECQALRSGTNRMLYLEAQRRWRETAEQLRKVEKDLAAILQSQNEVIPLSVATRRFTAIAREAQANLLGLPRACAQRLAGMTRPTEIEGYLRREIEGVLAAIAEATDD